MSHIIAARFETFEQAEGAARALMAAGVVSDDMHTFFVNPAGAHDRFALGGDRPADPDSKGAPAGAYGGAAALAVVGAVIGSLIGFSFGHSLLPVAGGAGVGAYLGALIGGLSKLGKNKADRSPRQQEKVEHYGGRPAGVLLAVRVDLPDQQGIASILRQQGGVEIERAQGRWEEGKWKDFDPLTSPDAAGDASRPAGSGSSPAA